MTTAPFGDAHAPQFTTIGVIPQMGDPYEICPELAQYYDWLDAQLVIRERQVEVCYEYREPSFNEQGTKAYEEIKLELEMLDDLSYLFGPTGQPQGDDSPKRTRRQRSMQEGHRYMRLGVPYANSQPA